MAEMWHKCVPVSTLRVSKGCRKGVENQRFGVIKRKIGDFFRHFDTLPTPCRQGGCRNYSSTATTIIANIPYNSTLSIFF